MIIDETALAAELLARHGVTTSARLAGIGISRRAVQTPNYDLPAAGDDLARSFATTVNQPYP